MRLEGGKFMSNSQIENRTLFTGDNLEVMRAMNSESVDLIYLDPPFNKKFVFPIGKGTDAKFGFTDIWGFGKGKDDPYLQETELAAYSELLEVSELFLHRPPEVLAKKDAKTLLDFLEMMGRVGDESAMAYLSFMAIRLLEMKRILRPTGSIYLHCDPTMSHSIKLLMDIIFGGDNYRNEIVWCYTRMASKQRQLSRVHDIIFWYSKSDDKKWIFNVDDIRLPYAESSKKRAGYAKKNLGGGAPKSGLCELNKSGKFPEDWVAHIPFLRQNERTGYPTQKPIALLERIIKASSNEGDLVLDPFCGCATTCVAAERLNREWIGIDVAEEAARQVRNRLTEETKAGKLSYQKEIRDKIPQVYHRLFRDPSQRPMRTDILQKRSANIKRILFGLQEGKCNLCENKFDIQNFHVDHIVAKAKGGLDVDSNLQLLCGHCNSVKGKGTMQRARDRLRELGYAA